MNRRPPHRSRLRRIGSWTAALVLVCTAAAAAAAGQAGREERAGVSAADIRRGQVEEWKGRYCTPTGCSGGSESPWASAAGFGTVVLATGWIARRRSARND